MKRTTYLADEYLDFAASVPPSETDTFFYTRLKARMQRSFAKQQGTLYLVRPRLMVGALSILLVVNSLLFVSMKESHPVQTGNELQTFATSYDLNITTLF